MPFGRVTCWVLAIFVQNAGNWTAGTTWKTAGVHRPLAYKTDPKTGERPLMISLVPAKRLGFPPMGCNRYSGPVVFS